MPAKKTITLLNITGGPVIKEGSFGFTEGGLVHALFSLANLSTDYDITILCPDFPGRKIDETTCYKGVKIVCLAGLKRVRWMQVGSLSFLRKARRQVRKNKPDIMIGNGVLATALLRFSPRSALRIGIVHHLYHDHAHHASDVTGISGFRVRVMGWLEKIALCLTKVDKVAVINPIVKEILSKNGFCPEDIVVTGNGVDVEEYSFATGKDPDTLIYIGRLVELKGIDILLEAVSEIRREIPAVKVHLVGDGPERARVYKKILDLGIKDNVVLHGYVSEQEKIALLRRAGVYVSASRFEGFGIPVIEAMATGAVPVISDIASHRFIFQGRAVGHLVKSKDELVKKVLELLSDEEKRQEIAHSGRRLVEERWTWATASKQYRKIIEEGLNSQ
jgi:glycosyltransferase involved in cell wall biosynthesis